MTYGLVTVLPDRLRSLEQNHMFGSDKNVHCVPNWLVVLRITRLPVNRDRRTRSQVEPGCFVGKRHPRLNLIDSAHLFVAQFSKNLARATSDIDWIDEFRALD